MIVKILESLLSATVRRTILVALLVAACGGSSAGNVESRVEILHVEEVSAPAGNDVEATYVLFRSDETISRSESLKAISQELGVRLPGPMQADDTGWTQAAVYGEEQTVYLGDFREYLRWAEGRIGEASVAKNLEEQVPESPDGINIHLLVIERYP